MSKLSMIEIFSMVIKYYIFTIMSNNQELLLDFLSFVYVD